MKKILIGALAVYAIVACLLLWRAHEQPQSLRILTLREDRSRLLITPEETIDIPLFFSSREAFFVSDAMIRGAKITDGEEEIDVEISVLDYSETVTYDETKFYVFGFRLGFPSIWGEGLTLCFEEAFLEIEYENEVDLSMQIGTLSLSFHSLDLPGHLDMTRLYGVMGETTDGEYLRGIVLGLAKEVGSPIRITEISTGLCEAAVDFSRILPWEDSNRHPSSVEEAMDSSEFVWIREDLPGESGSLEMGEEVMWFIPLVHHTRPRYLSRFPIKIRYEYEGNSYEYLIDDFLFFSTERLPEVLWDAVYETAYHY